MCTMCASFGVCLFGHSQGLHWSTLKDALFSALGKLRVNSQRAIKGKKMDKKHDVFQARLLEDVSFEGRYEYPIVKGGLYRPLKAIGFDRAPHVNTMHGLWLHFYVHDIRFQGVILHSEQYLRQLRSFAGVIGLDASVYRNLPIYKQIANIGHNREFDVFLSKHNIPFVPNVSWGDWRSYDFCFDGIAHEGSIAVSSHGCVKNPVERQYFLDGLYEALRRLNPKIVVFHGPIPNEAREMIENTHAELLLIKTHFQLAFQGEECENG